ncbi:MAG: benzoate/H(+) symporter BenE family transporter [Bacillota bacterium]|nr:benzoate/H(+) symporter BenE family transporter [Bacillota bacterium]
MEMRREYGAEQPFIPLGIFKLRLPFIHYRWEWPEALQALLMCATCLGAIPVLTEVLGVSFEIALTMVIINGALYNLHVLLGDPVVPGWITPAIPLTIAYLTQYPIGPERTQALIALQLLVGIFFVLMGITGAAKKLINWVPDSIKAGILLGAGMAAVIGEVKPGGRFEQFPITILIGGLLALFFLFSRRFKEWRRQSKAIDSIAKYGMLPALAIALIIGPIVKELPIPQIEWEVFVPRFGELFREVTPFGIGFPALRLFVAALPMLFAAYIIAFGDFVTSKALITEADEVRKDEKIDFNENRSNLISGFRNIIQAFISPYTQLCGPLWAAVTAAVSERYKDGRDSMDSIFSGMGTFRIMTFVGVSLMPIVSLIRPVLPVALSLTLLVQGFVCTRIAMDIVKTNEQKGVAGVMGAVLAIKGAAWGLAAGILLYLLVESGKAEAKKVEA